jgi:hypothetical protein
MRGLFHQRYFYQPSAIMTTVTSGLQDIPQESESSLDWKAQARLKAESIKALILPKWRLPPASSVEDHRDVRGVYVHQFLSQPEIEITETDAVGIVKQTSSGTWSAVEVTSAFCHRTALAHQLVRTRPIHFS